jgi:hypothetical protein
VAAEDLEVEAAKGQVQEKVDSPEALDTGVLPMNLMGGLE